MGFFDTYVKIKQTADLGNARAELENIRHQNAHLLYQTERQNEHLNALRGQISAANAVNRQILENQLKEAERLEKQRFYKDYLFLITGLLPEILKLPAGPIRYDIFDKLRPILQGNAEIAMEELEEIQDKTAGKKILEELSQMDNNLKKDQIVHSKSLLNGFREIEAEYLDIKSNTRPKAPEKNLIGFTSAEKTALAHAKEKKTTPGKLIGIGIGVTALGLIVLILPMEGMRKFLGVLGGLGSFAGGLYIIFGAAKRLRTALAKEVKNSEIEVAFHKEKEQYKVDLTKWEQTLSEHEYNPTVSAIRAKFPGYFPALQKIEEITATFASKWQKPSEDEMDE